MRTLSGIQFRVRRRFTAAGQVVLAATLCFGLFGVDTRQSLAYVAFSLGVVLLLMAWIGSLRRPGRLFAERRLPRYATLDEPFSYPVVIGNAGHKALDGLSVRETWADPRPDLATFLKARAPGEEQVNPLDWLFAYPRWHWLMQQGRSARPQTPLALQRLLAGQSQTLRLTLVPCRRGVLRLRGLTVSRTDVLGLAIAALDLPQADRLLVLPRRYPVRPHPLPGRRRLQPGGVNLAASVGDSREFIGLRGYRPGDSPRHIHWAAWARCGEPVVKEYQDEYFSRQALILDSFVSSASESDFEAAVSVAASLVEPLQGTDSLLDLMFVADRAYTLTGGRGLTSTQGLLETLACVQPAEGPFAQLTQAVLSHASSLSAGLCVLLAWDPARRALVDALCALGMPVRVLVIGAPRPVESRAEMHFLHPDHLRRDLAAL